MGRTATAGVVASFLLLSAFGGLAWAKTENGTEGFDALRGTDGADGLYGLGGNDDVRGRDGGDRLEGGPGTDVVVGGRGADLVRGGTGGDYLFESRESVQDPRRLSEGARDTLEGGEGADLLYARNRQEARRDVVRCGPGTDEAVVDRADRVSGDCEEVRRR